MNTLTLEALAVYGCLSPAPPRSEGTDRTKPRAPSTNPEIKEREWNGLPRRKLGGVTLPNWKEALIMLGAFVFNALPILLLDKSGKAAVHSLVAFGFFFVSGVIMWVVGMMLANNSVKEQQKKEHWERERE